MRCVPRSISSMRRTAPLRIAATTGPSCQTVSPLISRNPPSRSSSSVADVMLTRKHSRFSLAHACMIIVVLPLPDSPVTYIGANIPLLMTVSTVSWCPQGHRSSGYRERRSATRSHAADRGEFRNRRGRERRDPALERTAAASTAAVLGESMTTPVSSRSGLEQTARSETGSARSTQAYFMLCRSQLH